MSAGGAELATPAFFSPFFFPFFFSYLFPQCGCAYIRATTRCYEERRGRGKGREGGEEERKKERKKKGKKKGKEIKRVGAAFMRSSIHREIRASALKFIEKLARRRSTDEKKKFLRERISRVPYFAPERARK